MSVSLTFRCPDDLAELIKSQVETTGKDKTSVLVAMLKQSLLALPLEERNNLPAIPAIYLVYQQDKLLYIGKTKNLKTRWLSHHRLVQFVEAGGDVYIAWFPCDEEELEAMEDAFIELLDPEFNFQPGTKKILATFRIDKEEWQRFKALCASSGSNASSVLNEFVTSYIARNRLPSIDSIGVPNTLSDVKQTLDDCSTDKELDNVEQLLDERITTKLDERFKSYEAQLEELRGKLKAW